MMLGFNSSCHRLCYTEQSFSMYAYEPRLERMSLTLFKLLPRLCTLLSKCWRLC